MRRTLTLCRTGLAGVAAFVLLTACSGDDSGGSSASSSPSASESTSSSPAETSGADPAAAEFCTQAFTAFAQLQTVANTNDPAQITGALQQLTTSLDQIQAPAEISADWQTLLDALKQLTTTATSLDLTTPEGQQQFQEAEAQLTAQVGPAQTNVSNYLTRNCAQATGSSAAPTT